MTNGWGAKGPDGACCRLGLPDVNPDMRIHVKAVYEEAFQSRPVGRRPGKGRRPSRGVAASKAPGRVTWPPSRGHSGDSAGHTSELSPLGTQGLECLQLLDC